MNRPAASSATFTKRQRDAAFQCELERLVAWARELLDATPRIIDSEAIRDRRTEAARAVLDVACAGMAEYNAMEGEPHPIPARSPTCTRLRFVVWGDHQVRDRVQPPPTSAASPNDTSGTLRYKWGTVLGAAKEVPAQPCGENSERWQIPKKKGMRWLKANYLSAD